MNKRGLKTKEYLVNEILLLKKGDNRLTAKAIREKLVGLHPNSKSIPKERAIYKILERNKDKTISSELDNRWSAGSCLKYGISLEIVLSIHRLLLQSNRFLTIRRARWYSALHPILFPLLEATYPGQLEENQIRLFQISSYYSRAEQITEIDGDDTPDTSDMDNTFFINQDFSLEASLRIWGGLYSQTPEKPTKADDAKPIEQILGDELTAREVKLLDKFIELCASDNFEKAAALADKNKIVSLAERWLALSLRRDIKINKYFSKHSSQKMRKDDEA